MDIQKLGRERKLGRRLFFLALDDPTAMPSRLDLGSEHFVCLIAWDADGVDEEMISRVAEPLLDSGCLYVCAWGRDCERVHDNVDTHHVLHTLDREDIPFVSTTWHARDTLDDALWFFLDNTFVDDEYAGRCRAGLAVSIGGDAERNDRIRFALQHPQRFDDEVLANEED